MIIQNQYGSVQLLIDFKKYKKIGISFSGGCDSTLLLYFLLKIFHEKNPESEIYPITGIATNKGKWKLLRSQQILDDLINQFPSTKNKVKDRIIHYNTSQMEYRKFTRKLCSKSIIDIRLFALTKNPPYEVMEKHDLLRKREILRDEEEPEIYRPYEITGSIYEPFRNVDKRWIAQCYHDYGLMSSIYPLTMSCERVRDTPQMFDNEEPCRHCWWCREKKMAFGTYDGGVT